MQSRVLHIITWLDEGGAEELLYRLCSHGGDTKHQVISLMGLGRYGALLQQANVEVNVLNMPRGCLTLGGPFRLWQLIREAQPDVVQTWMYHANFFGGIAAKLAGVPMICWGIHHTTLDPNRESRTTRVVAWLNVRLSRVIPTAVVFCGERARQAHAALGYDASKLLVIPNGYDCDLFRPDPAARARLRAEWGMGSECAAIGTVARFDESKDHRNLIEAAAALRKSGREFRLVLVGQGMDNDNRLLGEWLERSGLADVTRLCGQRTDIPAVMNALDIHALPSCSEAFPNVLAEAMACGTPCVSTDVGDAADIVGETGWIVPPRNPAELAENLAAALDALGDQPLWESRRCAARERVVARFSLAQMVEAYQRLWCCGEARGKGPTAPRIA